MKSINKESEDILANKDTVSVDINCSSPNFSTGKSENFEENPCEISIIVCCYNPKIEALKFTLESILNQREINFELVISDDGSVNNLSGEIEEYLRYKGFKNWKMVCNEHNCGTVRNIYSGLKVSSGKYIKVIAPGDALHGETVLRKWIDFNEKNGYRWSFSDSIYYVGNPYEKKAIAVQARPNNIKPYIKKNTEVCRWNYMALDDIALGATLLCESKLEMEYMNRILDKVIYAEDNIYRMMMFDGITGGYFPQNAVLYEYGTGISTNGNSVWVERLQKDWKMANDIMLEKGSFDKLQENIIKAWDYKSKGEFGQYLIKGKLKGRIFRKIKRRMTDNKFD